MDELCRLCSSKNKLINIFTTRMNGNMSYMRYVIKVASGVEILETDKISHEVCLTCWTLSTSIYQFRQRSSKNNQELIDAHNKRKQREFTRIKSYQNDSTENNNTNCNLENELKLINLHPSIVQIEKQYPNLRLPPLQPDSHFQPFIILSNNEVNEWLQNQNPTENAIIHVSDKCAEKTNTLSSVGCSSLQNADVDFNQVESNSTEKIKGIPSQNNEETKCQTAEKRASIAQTQNKEEDKKRKKSNNSDKNSEIVPLKKMKSSSTDNYGDTSQKVANKNLNSKNHLVTVQKNESRPVSFTKLHIDQKSEEILQKLCETTPGRVVLQKLTIGSETRQNNVANNNLTHSFPEQCSSTTKRVLFNKDDSNVSCSKFKLTNPYPGSLRSSKQHEKIYDPCTCTFCSHHLESIEDRKKHMLFYCPNRTIRMPKVVLNKVDNQKEIVSKYAKSFCSTNSEHNESTSIITANTERNLFSKDESNISCSKSKKIESKKLVVEVSPSKEDNNQKLTISTEQNKATQVEITDEKLPKGIHFSALKKVLKGKLIGSSTPENVQKVHYKDRQETVVVEAQKSQNNNADNLEINTVTALSSFSNDDDNTDTLNNSLKMDFVKSLNLMPCLENTEYEAYTKNELLSVRYVKLCCKYCNSYHNSLRSLKQHEKKSHTSCAFCSHHLESIEERKKHMLFYCSKRTIRMPKVVLTKVDKQKEIASKYEKSFSINSWPNENASEITPNTEEQTKIQTDSCTNLQDSETTQDNVIVDFLCDLSAHTPLFKIANYKDVSMISSRKPGTLNAIYNTVKHRTVYTLDTVTDNTVDGEYCLKDLASELCFQEITVAIKYGESIRFQYTKGDNLSDLNIQQNFWNDETVTYPPMRTNNSQPETRQVVPGQIIEMQSNSSRNK